MPKGDYTIQNGRDTSFRSCMIAIVIFLFLCIIIIIVSWTLKPSSSGNDHPDETAKGSGALKGEMLSTTKDPAHRTVEEKGRNEKHTSVPSTSTSRTSKTTPTTSKIVTTSSTITTTSTTSTTKKDSAARDKKVEIKFLTFTGDDETTESEVTVTVTKPSTSVHRKHGSLVDAPSKTDPVTTTEIVKNMFTDKIDPSHARSTSLAPTDPPTENPHLPSSAEVCEELECKRVSARSLVEMGHSASPCENFYSFACGGLQNDPFLLEHDYSRDVWVRISKEVDKINNHSIKPLQMFKDFLISCSEFNPDEELDTWKKEVSDVLRQLGNFKALDPGAASPDFTRLFTGLLKYHSPFVFDVRPDVNTENSKRFILKVYPAGIDDSPFAGENLPLEHCHRSVLQSVHHYDSLNDIYDNITSCLKMTKDVVPITKEALNALGIFEGHKNATYEISELAWKYEDFLNKVMNNTYIGTRAEQKYQLTSKIFTSYSVGRLQELFPLVNWATLLTNILDSSRNVTPESEVYLYGEEYLEDVYNYYNLTEEGFWDLSDSLLTAFVEARYTELLRAQRPEARGPFHCERLAGALVEDATSFLYLRSFTPAQLVSFTTVTRSVFVELTKELQRQLVEDAVWLDKESRMGLLSKIRTIKLFNEGGMKEYNEAFLQSQFSTVKINQTNFVKNVFTFMHRYRGLMYSAYRGDPTDELRIWSQFILPFHSDAISIYHLNAIAIPFGKMAPPFFHVDYPWYVNMATVGSMIAHEIAHHFDRVGITISSDKIPMLKEHPLEAYKEMKNCVENRMLSNTLRTEDGMYIDMTINPLMTYNELLSDIVGVQLAFATYKKELEKNPIPKKLPFLEMNSDQMFFLRLGQSFCTKKSMRSLAMELFESQYFPGPFRVHNMVVFSKDFRDSFKCSEHPPCNVFPLLEKVDYSPDPSEYRKS